MHPLDKHAFRFGCIRMHPYSLAVFYGIKKKDALTVRPYNSGSVTVTTLFCYICSLLTAILAGEGNVFLLGYAAHIEDGVSHTAKGGVDADIGSLRYLFETHILKEAHVNNLTLQLRKTVH